MLGSCKYLTALIFLAVLGGCSDAPDPVAPLHPIPAARAEGNDDDIADFDDDEDDVVDDDDDNATDDGGEPHFLRPAPDAPALASVGASFWAVKGADREVQLWYRPDPGTSDSTQYLNFHVPADGLLLRPDGTSIASGDSVLITVTVIDPSRLIVQFQPSGLRFHPNHQARLRLSYAETDDDLDGDGDDDQSDKKLEHQLRIWCQESAADAWKLIPSTVSVGKERVSARIPGFTNYAIAF